MTKYEGACEEGCWRVWYTLRAKILIAQAFRWVGYLIVSKIDGILYLDGRKHVVRGVNAGKLRCKCYKYKVDTIILDKCERKNNK